MRRAPCRGRDESGSTASAPPAASALRSAHDDVVDERETSRSVTVALDRSSQHRLDDAHDLHPGPLQVGDGGIAGCVGAEYDGPVPGPNRVEIDQTTDRG